MMERSVRALACSSLQRDSVTLTCTSSRAVTQQLPLPGINGSSYKARLDDDEDDVTLALVVCKAFIWQFDGVPAVNNACGCCMRY